MQLRYERPQALALLKEKPGTTLSSAEIASKAHRRWDLKQHHEAALLFCLACERSQQESALPCQAPNYFVRAAITFNQAGDTQLAEPMLREATHMDWTALGLPHDSHMCEWAFEQLLLNLHQGPAEDFKAVFEQAVARCAELGWEFPKIHPKQEALLLHALQLQQTEVVQCLVERIRKRRPLSRAARAQLQAAEQWLASTL